jgi:hypothetical protein
MTICPNCRHVHEENAVTMQGISYGAPIKLCKRCGKEYYDPHVREAALTATPALPRPQKLRGLIWGAILVPLLFLAAALLLHTENSTLLLTCGILLAVIYAFSFLLSWMPYYRAKRQYARELVRSKLRLAQASYVEKLMAYREQLLDELEQ